MRKGEATRQRIVVRTADLLNTQGYRGTPVSEIMRVAGLQKGGIYRHFESRDALTLEAFDFAVARVRNRFLQAIEGRETAKDKLFALLDVARHALREEAFHGGCPVMNLAVESDDADPKLRDAARRAMRQVIGLFEQVIAEGMKEGEFPEGDARARARMLVASMEGAILLTNLYKDGAYMEAVLDHLARSVRRGFR
jgi:TetR/AcrR family transcriptional regulator, transcriptional repressor for nem operon